jgi:hypothetical protein
MAGRGVPHITNGNDDRRSLRRIEVNLCGTGGLRLTGGPYLRGTCANAASQRDHNCSGQKTAVHGAFLLLVRGSRYLCEIADNFLNGAGVPEVRSKTRY